jgi:hypothetical protein
MGLQPSDPSDPPFPDFSIVKNSKTADHLDHLDHLGLEPLPDKETSAKNEKCEGEIYYSLTLGKKVKIVKIYPSVRKADVLISGEIEKSRVKLTDLYPVPGDNWPNLNNVAMYGDKLVAIVGYSGRKFQIEFADGRMIYVKASYLTKP